MKRFNNWSISTKVMSISMLTIVIIMAGMILYYIPLVKGKLMGEKKTALKDHTDIAFTLVNSYQGKIKAGELKPEEAKRQALANLKAIRYSGDEYFFITDVAGKIVMHPINTQLDGKDMSNEKDPEGKYFFREMSQLAREKGCLLYTLTLPTIPLV